MEQPSTELTPDPMLGKTIGGKFKIVKLVGEGGMGCVYLGEQSVGDAVRKVAIKTLHVHLSKDPKILARFERECGTIAQLQHPNTIQLYDFGKTDDGILYMVMEFVQGESLASVLEKQRFIEPSRAEHILSQICDALGEAHALGIVHRDLKPDNIVLTERAKDWVKVLDFGIAKRSEQASKEEQKLTQQGTVLGTPPYMSPEQFTGKPIDQRSDIYSIAVMAYEMLAGRLPFDAATPWEWATQHMTVPPHALTTTPSGSPVPERMKAAVMRALEKEPEKRFATTREFFEAFSGGGAPAAAVAPAAVTSESGPSAKGKTQVGAPLEIPGGAFSPPGASEYGAPPASPPGAPSMGAAGAHYGTPEVANVAYPAPAAVPQGPRAQRPGKKNGPILAAIGILAVASVGAIVFSLTRGHSQATPLDLGTDAEAPPETTVSAAPVASSSAPPLDTSLAQLTGTNTGGGGGGHVTPPRRPDAGKAPPQPPPSQPPPQPPPPSGGETPQCQSFHNAQHNPGIPPAVLASMRIACINSGGKP